MKRLIAIAAAALFALTGTSAQAANTPQNLDWPHYGGQYDEAGYAALDQIDVGNVKRLGLAWSLDLPGEQSLEATPLAVNGVLYFTGSFADVYAVSAATGRLLWKHEVKVWEFNPQKMHYIFPLNRGVAYADGRVFVGATDGRLIALDAKTGQRLWSVETVERGDRRTITGAPRTFKGKVIIGQGGGDSGSRGYVTAYDQATGRQAWRFYVVPGSPEENRGDPAMEMAARTWGSGEYWKTGTGGTVWHGITFDPELGRIYIGTGNSGPYDAKKRRSRRRRQSVPSLDRRARSRHRQISLALSGQPARGLGLQGDDGHGHRDADYRRQTPQGADAGADQRLFLCARPRDRQTDLRRKDRQGDLGGSHRHRDRPPGRAPGHPLRERPGGAVAVDGGGAQLAGDVV